MFNRLKNNKGFTLIELLVVVAIIGVLSSVVISSLSSARSKARDAKRISDVRQIQTALEMYYADKGYYPEFTSLNPRCNTRPAATNSLAVLKNEGFMPSVPDDPRNITSTPNYCYEYTGIGTLSNYPDISGVLCGGTSRTNYRYVLLFSLENSSSSFPAASISYYTHCIHGGLK